jgi:hypothetical protein
LRRVDRLTLRRVDRLLLRRADRRPLPALGVLSLLGVLGLLGACAAVAPGEPVAGGELVARGDNWLAFAATLATTPAFDRATLTAQARNAHATTPTAESAIRLAILLAESAGAERDLAEALTLLDFAAADPAALGDGDADFVAFFRPLVRQLAGQRAALDAEAALRQSLERQLEALKALEEQLNADDAR